MKVASIYCASVYKNHNRVSCQARKILFQRQGFAVQVLTEFFAEYFNLEQSQFKNNIDHFYLQNQVANFRNLRFALSLQKESGCSISRYLPESVDRKFICV